MGNEKSQKRRPSDQQIEEFLEEFRSCSRPRVNIQPRPEYFKFMAYRNLVQKDAEKIILEDLNASHHKDGPEPDRNNRFEPGEVWKFEIEKFGSKIYIKLKLYENKLGMLQAKCLSFHD